MSGILLGSVLVLGLVFGGRSTSGNSVDAVLLIWTILVSVIVLFRNDGLSSNARVSVEFVTTGILLVVLQLVPLPTTTLMSTQGVLPPELVAEIADSGRWPTVSLDPGKTLFVLAWLCGLSIFLWALSSQSTKELTGLIPYLLAGALLNVIAALVQFVAPANPTTVEVGNLFTEAGFFANPNHFGTLIFASLPLLIACFINRRNLLLIVTIACLALISIAATGSRAAIFGCAIAVVGGILIRYRFHTLNIYPKITLSVGVASLCTFAVMRIGFAPANDSVRLAVYRNTLSAIQDNLPVGTGFGTFEQVYRRYEPIDQIRGYFINHAHNDFLELILEGGVVMTALLVIGFTVLARRIHAIRQSPIQYAAGLSITLILLHSMVDYPLRTFGLSATFCLLIAILFAETDKRVSVSGTV